MFGVPVKFCLRPELSGSPFIIISIGKDNEERFSETFVVACKIWLGDKGLEFF